MLNQSTTARPTSESRRAHTGLLSPPRGEHAPTTRYVRCAQCRQRFFISEPQSHLPMVIERRLMGYNGSRSSLRNESAPGDVSRVSTFPCILRELRREAMQLQNTISNRMNECASLKAMLEIRQMRPRNQRSPATTVRSDVVMPTLQHRQSCFILELSLILIWQQFIA